MDELKPVDPQLFLFCSRVFFSAAGMVLPTVNPESIKGIIINGQEVNLSDNSVNRGLVAVAQSLTDISTPKDTANSALMRIMQIGDVYKHPDLTTFYSIDDDGNFNISETLIKACASANLIFDAQKDDIRFDIADVARIAKEINHKEG